MILTFYYDFGLYGLWVGLTIGLMLVSSIQLVVLFNLDWEKEARNAHLRVGDHQPSSYDTFDDVETATSSSI